MGNPVSFLNRETNPPPSRPAGRLAWRSAAATSREATRRYSSERTFADYRTPDVEFVEAGGAYEPHAVGIVVFHRLQYISYHAVGYRIGRAGPAAAEERLLVMNRLRSYGS